LYFVHTVTRKLSGVFVRFSCAASPTAAVMDANGWKAA
jgi:hypothetical protein